MLHQRLLLSVSLLTLGVSACATSSPPADRPIAVYVPGASAAPVDQHHPMPSQCASGCDVLPPALLVTLSAEAIAENLAAYAKGDPEAQSQALDTLLFYAADTRAFLDAHPSALSQTAHRQTLQRELSRAQAEIELRVKDDSGVVRAFIPSLKVPLGQKQHLRLQHRALPGLVASGTVLRVGRDRLWTRI